MSDLNVGIVGLGWVAGAHIETFKSVNGAQVSAVCSRRELDETELEKQYGVRLKTYRSYEEMLQDPSIDIIDICTPHPYHPDQTIAAAEAGKHVLIEKPIAIQYEDTLRMRKAIRDSGVKSCVCFEVRFSHQGSAIHSVIEEGLLGDLHYGEADYYHGIGPWYGQFEWNIKKDMGASSLLTAGCHALDLLLWCMGGDVDEVTSYSTLSKNETFQRYEYDASSVTILKFKDGRIGKVASVVDCLQPYYFHIHLVGSQGSLLDDRFYSHKLDGLDKNQWSSLGTHLIDSGDVADHPYTPQFQSFVDSIQEGVEMPRTNFEEAFKSHRVVFAADRSAEDKRPVKLSEFSD